MYDLVMKEQEVEPGIVPEALEMAMRLRGVSGAELARRTGVSTATISLILTGKRHGTTAGIVGKLAQALEVSVDFLMGYTSDPTPRSVVVGELVQELFLLARHLPRRKQRDLLTIARAYVEDNERAEQDPDRLENDLLDLLVEYAGEERRDELLAVLEKMLPAHRPTLPLPESGKQPGDGNR